MLERIGALCAGPHRGSATAAELEAVRKIAGWMRDLGVADVREEPFRGHRALGWSYLLHFALLAFASFLGMAQPAAAEALTLVATLSLYGQLSMRFFWLSALVPFHDSANVVGRLPASAEVNQTLILCAHHDTPKPGLLFREPVQRAAMALERHPDERTSSPMGLPWISALAQLVLLPACAMGWLPGWVLAVPATVFLITAVLVGQWAATGGFVMGANDNASGVALMLEVAGELARAPLQHCEVLLLSSGCEESGCGGVRSFLDRHGGTLDRQRTCFLVLDTLAKGELRYVSDEHMLATHRSDPELIAELETLGQRGPHAPLRPYSAGLYTDAYPIMARGFRALALLGWDREWYARHYHQHSDTPEHLDPAALERARAVVSGLLRQLDSGSRAAP